MKTMKKILAVLLCLVMLMGIAPLSANAATYSFKSDGPLVPGEKPPEIYDSNGKEVPLYTWYYYDDSTGKKLPNTQNDVLVGRRYFLECYVDDASKYTEVLVIEGSECTFAYKENGLYDTLDTVAFYVNPAKPVSTYDELKAALESSEPLSIRLANDINKEIPLGDSAGGEAAQITVNGQKWLDLNGYKLNVRDRSDVSSNTDYTLVSIRTLFTVPAGAEFVVNDGTGKGEVKYDAHFIGPNISIGLIIDYARYTHIAQRNMFKVEGKLTVNGGKFDAGGAKEQYLSDKACNAYQIAEGYIAKTEGSGEAVINAGEFIGHTRIFSCYLLSGNILINGGSFTNEGTGYMLDPENNSKIRIINGSFDVKTHSKVRYNWDRDDENSCGDWTIGTFNIPAGAWNSAKSIVMKDGKLCFSPAADYLMDYCEDAPIDIYTPGFTYSKPGFGSGTTASLLYPIGNTTYSSERCNFQIGDLPRELADRGYSLSLNVQLYDTKNKKIADISDKEEVVVNPYDYCKTPGTYTCCVFLVLRDSKDTLCGLQKYTVTIKAVTPCTTHDFYVSEMTATCTSGGVEEHTCTKCGYIKSSVILGLGHTYEEYDNPWSFDDNAHWKYCYRCGKNTTNKIQHFYQGDNVCDGCGYDKSCKPYDDAMDYETDATHHWWLCETHGEGVTCPNDHKMDYEAHVAVTDPKSFGNENANTAYNCGEGYVCEGCGCYFGETGNHIWEVMARAEPTCKDDGKILYRCTYTGKIDPHGNKITGHYKSVVLPATGEHKYVLVSDTATCSKDGVATYKCSGSMSCGETYTVTSPETGHIYALVSDTATCDKAGTATYKCTTCTDSYTEASPAKGHNHIEESYTAPTVDTEGKATYKCSACGNIKTENLGKLTVISQPKTKSINCKDGVLIRPNIANIPEGATIEWTASNGCFNWSVDADGNLKAISNSSGDTTFTAKVKLEDGTYMKDMYGQEVVDQTTVKSNAGFFQKLIGFFKSLFGATKIYE